jgi:hypothetical protein
VPKTQIERIRIAAIDRSLSAPNRPGAKGQPSWVMALVLEPTPTLAWLDIYESTFSQLSVERRLAFAHDLSFGQKRRIYHDYASPGLWTRALRLLRRRPRVILSVTSPASKEAAQRALVEAQWLVSTVNGAFESALSARAVSEKVYQTDVALFSESLKDLEQEQIRNRESADPCVSSGDVVSTAGDSQAVAKPDVHVVVPGDVWISRPDQRLERVATT